MNLHCPHCDSPQPTTPLIAGKTWLCQTCSNSFGDGKAPSKRKTTRRVVQQPAAVPGRVESRRTGGGRPRASTSRVPKVAAAGGVKELGSGKKIPWVSIGAGVAVLALVVGVAYSLFLSDDKPPPTDDEETTETAATGETPAKPGPKPVKTKDPYAEFMAYHEARFGAEQREKKGDLSGAIAALDRFLSSQNDAIDKLDKPIAERVRQEVAEFRDRLEKDLASQWKTFEAKFKQQPSLSKRIDFIRSDLGTIDEKHRGPAMELLLPQLDEAILAAFTGADTLKASGAPVAGSAAVRDGLVLSYAPEIRTQVDLLLAGGSGGEAVSAPSFLFDPLRALVEVGTPEAKALATRMIDQALAAPEMASRKGDLQTIRNELGSGRPVTVALVESWADAWGAAGEDLPPGNCTPCSGNGRLVCKSCQGSPRIVEPCPRCANAVETTPTNPTAGDCPRCNGTGRVRHEGEERTLALEIDDNCWRLLKGQCSNCSAGIDGIVEYPVEADKVCGTCNGYKGMKGKSDPMKVSVGPCDESGKVGGTKCKDLAPTLQNRVRSQGKDLEKLVKSAEAWQKWYQGLDAELTQRVKEKADNLKYTEYSGEYNKLLEDKANILVEMEKVSARINKLVEDVAVYQSGLEALSSTIQDLLQCEGGTTACIVCSGTPTATHTPTTDTPKTACTVCAGSKRVSRTCGACSGAGGSACGACAGLGSTVGLTGPWTTMAANEVKKHAAALVAKLKARPPVTTAGAAGARPKDWAVEAFLPARLNEFRVRLERPLPERRRRAVESALQWLATHQGPDGGWHRDAYASLCRRTHEGGVCAPDGTDAAFAKAEYDYDVALTGLALLAFLGAGVTELSEGAWGDAVNGGLEYLRSKQSADGSIGDRSAREFLDGHTIATAALAEAYGMTGSVVWREAARKGVEFMLDELSPGAGLGMAFQGSKATTTNAGWGVMALKSAELAGLSFDRDAAYAGAIKWLDSVTKEGQTHNKFGSPTVKLPDGSGGEAGTPTPAAISLLCRSVIGDAAGIEKSAAAGESLKAALPGGAARDYLYYYFGTLAVAQSSLDGAAWQAGLDASVTALQSAAGPTKGSWDPDSQYCRFGGRIYATALCALTLEAESRYPRLRR